MSIAETVSDMIEIVKAIDEMKYAVLFHSEQWEPHYEPLVLARFMHAHDAIHYGFSCTGLNDLAIVTIVEI